MADSNKIIIDDGIVLPPMYQRVEYIEGTGTQYISINTGIAYKDIGIVQDIQFSDNINNQAMSQRYVVANAESCGLNFYNAFIGMCSKPLGITGENALERHIHDVSAHNNTYKLDGIIKLTKDIRYSSSDNEIANFGICCRNTAIRSKSKFYYGYVYDVNNVKQFEFIPCYRIEDGVAGMFDVVHEVFYTNAGTGEFAVGADVFAPEPEEPEEPEVPTLPKIEFLLGSPSEIRRRMMITAKTGGGEETSTFTPLAYIEGDGNAYIQIPYSKNTIKFDIRTSTYQFKNGIYGVIAQQGNLSMEIGNGAAFRGNYNKKRIFEKWDSGYNYPYRVYTLSNYGGEISAKSVYVREPNKILYTYNTSYEEIDALDKNIYLFYGGGSDGSRTGNKVADFKVYDENDELIMDCIAAQRDSDGEVGLYDQLNNKFYNNAGTGAFAWAPL